MKSFAPDGTPAFRFSAVPISQLCLGFFLAASGLVMASPTTRAQNPSSVDLPEGIRAVWDVAKAARETTPTRERLCINGLWRWQPATDSAAEVPKTAWGYYKVPANWPGTQNYMQSDYQTLHSHPQWANVRLGELHTAWYERTITIPQTWGGRRIMLDLEYLNSFAAVYVDGRKVGELRFPAGQVDLSPVVRPGTTHVLSLLVVAMPLKAVMESYTDTNTARQRKGTVERRGLCGDVFLVSEPTGTRLANVKIETSFRKGLITFQANVQNPGANTQCRLHARITDQGQLVAEFTGPAFSAQNDIQPEARFSASWKPARLWDIHTPENQFTAEVSLLDANGQIIDAALPIRFGFRELWIQGRDFYFNGTRLFLSAVPLDNAQVGAALATYEAARESLLRLKSFGINFVYTHNYGCEPGSHLSFAEILRAADDVGMLVALSQPHFSAYDWKSAEADQTNGYAPHAAFYVKVAGNHPSVVSYSMSHNATGYNEDMNPSMMDSRSNPRSEWSERNARLALRCEAIVKRLDPARLVYHHSSGDLSALYTINFYPNFVPIQELDDWFGHWSTHGAKPLLLVEYGAPFGWDWTMYRGWHNGRREFGSAAVPWEYCLAEWNAQFLGDAAYQISDREKRNLRWEAQQFRLGRPWFRWDYPTPVGDARLEEMQPVQAAYTTSNWRAFRTWGLSGNSPWEHARFWKLRDSFERRRQDLPVDWDHLQRPGYSPDFIDRTYARFDLAYERSDWVATPTAQSLLRNNQPLLAWIAGKPEHFTTKDHSFYAGETVAKQFIIINNSRLTVTGEASWSLDLNPPITGATPLVIPTGEQVRVPLQFKLPADLPPGSYTVKASFLPHAGERQDDLFVFQVVPRPVAPQPASRLAIFDPPGETTQLLSTLGVAAQPIAATTDLAAFDVLFIGKRALTVDGPAPALQRVRQGLKVVVFEQTGQVLERRLGFKVAEYGLRQAWPRVPDSPLLAGLSADNLRDWRGASTLLAPTLDYTLSPRYNGAPAVRWCGLEVPRLWRCGNRGNVASVLIEKPSRGDFLPIVEGGYALHYSPLLEYREGRGLILFCQMDLTARTENDPAAETMAANILGYVQNWARSSGFSRSGDACSSGFSRFGGDGQSRSSGGLLAMATPRKRLKPEPQTRTALYTGDPAGAAWLAAAGIDAAPYQGALSSNQVLVVGPGGPRKSAGGFKPGDRILALGLGEEEANLISPTRVTMRSEEHIATWFPPFGSPSLLAGVSPADLHNRDPRALPLLTGGATLCGNGVLAFADNVVFCQLAPFAFSQSPEQFNQRRTFVRASVAVNRLLANLGVSGSTPLLQRFDTPAMGPAPDGGVGRRVLTPPLRDSDDLDRIPDDWFLGLYLTLPTEWDDPYRFFRW